MKMLGVIGGTGLDRWGGLENELRGETPYGSTSTPIAVYEMGETCLMFIARHGFSHTIPPHRVNYRANLFALRRAGVNQVLALNAVGGIREPFAPGTLVAPDQLVDYTWGREQSFSDGDSGKLQHVEFSRPFEGEMRRRVLAAAAAWSIPMVEGGCVAVTQGPRLETAAEIERLREDGSDMVGMTSMPEASLARELGLDYASICVVSNWAAGIADEPISMEHIEKTLGSAMQQVRAIIKYLCENP